MTNPRPLALGLQYAYTNGACAVFAAAAMRLPVCVGARVVEAECGEDGGDHRFILLADGRALDAEGVRTVDALLADVGLAGAEPTLVEDHSVGTSDHVDALHAHLIAAGWRSQAPDQRRNACATHYWEQARADFETLGGWNGDPIAALELDAARRWSGTYARYRNSIVERFDDIWLDPILAGLVRHHAEDDDSRDDLVRFLHTSPRHEQFDVLLRHLGRRVPSLLHDVSLIDTWEEGRVVTASVSIGPDGEITWNAGTLEINGRRLPDATVAALPGRPLGDLVEHPYLPAELVVDEAISFSGIVHLTFRPDRIVVPGADMDIIPGPRAERGEDA